jgi:hypothetical protein
LSKPPDDPADVDAATIVDEVAAAAPPGIEKGSLLIALDEMELVAAGT